jgi:hypothetical protein
MLVALFKSGGIMSIVQVNGLAHLSQHTLDPNGNKGFKWMEPLRELRLQLVAAIAERTQQSHDFIDVHFTADAVQPHLLTLPVSCQVPVLVYWHRILEDHEKPVYRRNLAQALHELLKSFCNEHGIKPSSIQVHVAEPIYRGYHEYCDGRSRL